MRLIPPTGVWYRALFVIQYGPCNGGAPVVNPALARVATEGTRDGRALGLARAMAHATGLGLIARPLSLGFAAYTTYQRVVPRALFVIQCGPVVGVRLSCHQRTLASLMKAREMSECLASLGP